MFVLDIYIGQLNLTCNGKDDALCGGQKYPAENNEKGPRDQDREIEASPKVGEHTITEKGEPAGWGNGPPAPTQTPESLADWLAQPTREIGL